MVSIQCFSHVLNVYTGILCTARACAARGKVIEFVRCLLSVWPKILRWRKLATSRTSEHIRSTPTILTCTCYWADSLPLAGISAVVLLSGPLVSYFIYGHESRPQHMPRVHAHAQQSTLHSGCSVYSVLKMTVQRARGMCSIEL